MTDCMEVEFNSSTDATSKKLAGLGKYTKENYLINGRIVYKHKERNDYLYFNGDVWLVRDFIATRSLKTLNFSINENVLVILNAYFQIGSLFMGSQGVMRNKKCGDVWNPAETKCTGKWEFWNGRHWEIDTTIATLLIDCQGKIRLCSSDK